MRCRVSFALAGAFVGAFAVSASSARADVTTWLAFGAGVAVDHATAGNVTNFNPAFSGSIGVGSDPTHAFVLGGAFRFLTRFNEGTDINLSLRLTTGGFARGDWGFGFDLGPGARTWGNNAYGTYPLEGVVLLGAPWGLQASLGSDIVNLEGHPTSIGAFAVIEFDFLRFTLMRQGSTDKYWKNPLPVGGRMDPGRTEPDGRPTPP